MYEGVTFWYPYSISIGKNTMLNEWVYIDGYEKVAIGSGVRIDRSTSIVSSVYNIPKNGLFFVTSGIPQGDVQIGDIVFIGYNAPILKGVFLGEGAVFGVASVISKNAPVQTIVGAVPVKKSLNIDSDPAPASLVVYEDYP